MMDIIIFFFPACFCKAVFSMVVKILDYGLVGCTLKALKHFFLNKSENLKAPSEIWPRFCNHDRKLEKEKNIMKKGENVRNQNLVFQQCFSKLSFCMVIKTQEYSQLIMTDL